MPTKLYVWKRPKGGNKPVKTYLTSREVKAYIMKTNNWTSSQYQKQYDIFKNKLNAYESYQQARGVSITKQSPVEVLFKEAKAKNLYGTEYKPTMKLQQIKGFSAYSITKGKAVAKAPKYVESQSRKYGRYINKRFGGLIKNNTGAKNIKEAFKEEARKKGEPINYAKMEEALSDYADKLGAKYKPTGEAETPDTMPNGETYGSDEQLDFDVSDYL